MGLARREMSILQSDPQYEQDCPGLVYAAIVFNGGFLSIKLWIPNPRVPFEVISKATGLCNKYNIIVVPFLVCCMPAWAVGIGRNIRYYCPSYQTEQTFIHNKELPLWS